MSSTYPFSLFVPVLLGTYSPTYSSFCLIADLPKRTLLLSLKWQWMWRRSGTQSGWHWRFVENSREEHVRDRTMNASSPTLPRAVKWKTAESLLVLTHSRWVWQTLVTFIHHSPWVSVSASCIVNLHFQKPRYKALECWYQLIFFTIHIMIKIFYVFCFYFIG